MKEHIYRLGNGHELCRSASPVKFGEGFPQFSDIKPEITEKKAPAKKAEPKEKE